MDITSMPYRLKTARRKHQLLKKDRDRQLRRMEKEYKRLTVIKKELPFVPLEKPYQKGWKRLYVLRPEIARSEKAGFYQGIADAITEVQYHYDASFKPSKRKRRDKRYQFEKLPRLRAIDSYYWEHKYPELSAEQRECFQKVTIWNEARYQWDYCYEFTQPELFEIAIRPHIIDRVKLQDETLEQEMAFIDDYLYKFPYIGRLWKIKGGQYKYYYSRYLTDKLKYINPLKNRPLHLVLDEDW